MGLMLYPAGAEAESPDVSWSYTGFSMFRQWLARAEGLVPDPMSGFGGTRPRSDAATPRPGSPGSPVRGTSM
ncbi:hypothetical protein [Streptomyces alboflavus]|uniref:hypothetical protein n=1 Tax=Streptomyces alboflavus TaxID=67267 RepID=UPI000525D16B|nr:hypothetical protein [Streptomyces alboflavus]